MDKVSQLAEREEPRKEGEPDNLRQNRIRARSADVCRFLLPAAALANVGMTINARALEHAVTKMLSDPLAEVRSLGLEIKAAAQSEVPTLLKYADADPAQQEQAQLFGSASICRRRFRWGMVQAGPLRHRRGGKDPGSSILSKRE